MKKQKIALLLSLAWLVGLAALFSFPPSIKIGVDPSGHSSFLSELVSPELTFRSSGENPEVPTFKADWGLSALISSEPSSHWLPSHTPYLSSAYFTKSKSLFDVFVTFIYFFYTW